MAALTSANVRLIAAWTQGGLASKRQKVKRVEVHGGTWGGETNTMPATAFGFSVVEEVTPLYYGGAKKAYIVELNRDAIKVIERNVQTLKEEDSVIMWQMDYAKALERLQKDGIQFDLVLLDPPYKLNIMESLLENLHDRGLLKDGAQIICQYVKGNFSPFENRYYSIYKNYRYGNSEVCIYRYHLLQS